MLLSLLGVAGAASAAAQDRAPDARLARVGSMSAAHKPAGIPDDYVATPFGYFPPACVRQVHHGERILEDGALQHTDGTREPAQACTQDNFTASGTRVRPDGRGIDGQQVRSTAALAASRSGHSVPPPIPHSYTDGRLQHRHAARTHRGKLDSAAEPDQRGESDGVLLSGVAERVSDDPAAGAGLPRLQQRLGSEQLELLQGRHGVVQRLYKGQDRRSDRRRHLCDLRHR
jgi:hypothetical protein